jgi:hypothetical protein
LAFGGFDLHVCASPVDTGDRRRNLNRARRRELCEKRTQSLPAKCAVVAFGRAGNIDRREFREILAAAVGTQEEFDGRPPFAQVFRQDLRTGNVALARGVMDSGVGPNQACEEIFHLAFARVAPADAHALPGRREIEVKTSLRGELGNGTIVSQVNAVRAAVIRHAE